MKRLLVLLAAALMVLPATIPAQELDRVERYDNRGSYGRPDIEVWTDNNDGVYYEGENVTVYFRTDRDCFVAIYGVDTRGDVNLLYPTVRWDDGYVRGGEVYAIPGNDADFDLVVNGPEGMEVIQAIASNRELDIPNWYDGAPISCGYHDDRDEFIDYVNNRYFDCRFNDCERGFDRTMIYVKVPRYYYKPVYVPTYWNTYPDYAMIYIDYPYGGEIYIDGIFFGIAPLWIPRVIYGHHWFTIYDRYGYCWEEPIIINNHTTIHLDHSRVKTSRTVVSRFHDQDIRAQAKKYDRTSFVKSGERVKSVRDNDYRLGSKRTIRTGISAEKGLSPTQRSKTTRDGGTGWNTPREPSGRKGGGQASTIDKSKTETRGGSGTVDRSGSSRKGGDRSGTYDRSGSGSKGSDRPGTYDRSGSSKRSTPERSTPKIDRSSSSSSNSKGSATPSRSGGYKSSGSSSGSGSRNSGTTSRGSSSGSSQKGSGGEGKSSSGSGKRP